MAMTKGIDLNSDVGESFGVYKLGLDEDVIPLISSANIACGFHAGDPAVMRQTVSLAKAHGVAPGAHPGFRDRVGFGRRYVDATLQEIKDDVAYQVGALQAFAALQGLPLQHVKPHGGLYNMAARNPDILDAIAEVLAHLDRDLILVTLAGPNRERIEAVGERHAIRIAFEFFADRAYTPDGSLVSRRKPGAVLHDSQEVADRVIRMVTDGLVTAEDGSEIDLSAQTICVHGDNPAAVALVREIRKSLFDAEIEVVPMGNLV